MSRMQRVESLHQVRCKTSFALVPLQNQSCQTRMRKYYQFPQIPTHPHNAMYDDPPSNQTNVFVQLRSA